MQSEQGGLNSLISTEYQLLGWNFLRSSSWGWVGGVDRPSDKPTRNTKAGERPGLHKQTPADAFRVVDYTVFVLDYPPDVYIFCSDYTLDVSGMCQVGEKGHTVLDESTLPLRTPSDIPHKPDRSKEWLYRSIGKNLQFKSNIKAFKRSYTAICSVTRCLVQGSSALNEFYYALTWLCAVGHHAVSNDLDIGESYEH